jgi:hypothetical protein
MKYLISFYAPETHLEAVKEAMFAKGAGNFAKYSKCAWQTEGVGQFYPEVGSDPYLGQSGKIEHIKEYKVEMICKKSCLEEAVKALKQAHPYEEPAYNVILLEQS